MVWEVFLFVFKFFLPVPSGVWGLAKNRTPAVEAQSLTTRPPGKSQEIRLFNFYWSIVHLGFPGSSQW